MTPAPGHQKKYFLYIVERRTSLNNIPAEQTIAKRSPCPKIAVQASDNRWFARQVLI
jgi:hypothetical protein